MAQIGRIVGRANHDEVVVHHVTAIYAESIRDKPILQRAH